MRDEFHVQDAQYARRYPLQSFLRFARVPAQALGAAGLAVLLAVLPGSGQSVIAGTVLDAVSGKPVIGGRVLLMEMDEVSIRTTITDDEGAFVVSIGAGRYRIRVERLGYPTHTAEPITVAERDRVEVEILLHPQAIGLDSLVIVGRRRETGREAFERRRDSADRGTFLDPVHVALLEPAMPSDLLRRVEDLEVTHLDSIQHVMRPNCMVVFVDDMHRPIMATGAGKPEPDQMYMEGILHLNEFTSAGSVRGVEVYPTIADMPPEIRQGRRGPAIKHCGVVQVWTTIGW